jgi:hypothetical protein
MGYRLKKTIPSGPFFKTIAIPRETVSGIALLSGSLGLPAMAMLEANGPLGLGKSWVL